VRRGYAAAAGVVRKIVQQVRSAMGDSRYDMYRPEVHYMRGPGPMSRRRNAASGRRAPSKSHV